MQNNPLTFQNTSGRLSASIPKGAAPASEVSKIGAERGFRIWTIWSELPGYREVPGAPFGRRRSSGLFYGPQPKPSKPKGDLP